MDVTPHAVTGATSETPAVSDVASLIASAVIDGAGDEDRCTCTANRSQRSTTCIGAVNGSTICMMNSRAIARLKRLVTLGSPVLLQDEYPRASGRRYARSRGFPRECSCFTELWRA